MITLRNRYCEADVYPEMGANLARLQNRKSGLNALRVLATPNSIFERPNVHGTPLLFPPNRIAGGRYEFEGREYTFPINEVAAGNHIHGVLNVTPFELVEATDTRAATRFRATAEKMYLNFPHAFTIETECALEDECAVQRYAFTNDSALDMPFGTGLHTSFHAPENALVFARLGREWEIGERTVLPSGRTQAHSELAQRLEAGFPAMSERLSALFERGDGQIVVKHPEGEVVYETCEGYRFFMVYNADAKSSFFCTEPQTWINDAPNRPFPGNGMDFLRPGETRVLTTKLYFR